MKALIIYFTMGGRTKKAAQAIASALTEYEITYVPIEILGHFFKKMEAIDKQEKGDFSDIEEKLIALDTVAEYDLIIIGMPTYGGKPPKVFDEIMNRLTNLSGKRVALFTTGRFTADKALEYMKDQVEAADAEIIDQKAFNAFFRLRTKEPKQFGEELNQA